eukprot:15718819-Heterocapsa_arctica.AAC.1
MTTTTTAPSVMPKGKRKSNWKSKGKKVDGKFEGICNKCGRWGHKAKECHSAMSLEDGDVAQSINTMAEILSVDA